MSRTLRTPRLALLAATLAGLVATPAWAASSTSSAVSDSIGTSSNSLSNSVERSSKSSSKDDVAQGDYRIVQVATVAGRPGVLRLKLQPLVAAADRADAAAAEDDGSLYLTLPQLAFDRSRLGAGQVVTASQRPYGIEFARADNREAFFLVLADDWQRELQARPVAL
ncbi:MAG: hypothetical protein H7Z19_16690 [Chitinophagaceae bacterium]|nr:hypothetical protein [Rubrivivax sp.]